MATNVHMEALSPTMEEGRLVKWNKSEGDEVKSGDTLAEVETDKAVMELVARADGRLLKILKPEGSTVPVGEVVAYIGAPGEQVDAPAPTKAPAPAPAPQPAAEPKAKTPAKPAPAEASRASRASAPPLPAAPAPAGARAPRSGPAPAPAPVPAPSPQRPAETRAAAETGRVKASPLARRLAEERGVDLQLVEGSGPGGRVVKRDVEAGPRARTERSGAGQPAAARRLAPAERGEPYEDVPLTQIRKTIARRLAASLGPIPHFFLTSEIDMERAAEARESLNRELAESSGPKLSFNDIILKAVALALVRHPACNAWFQEDHIRYWSAVHLGMAVAVEDGLITPVIRDADRKSLAQIGLEARELASRARERRLQPAEYTGATFSVSNLGMQDIDQFTAVINPPEAGMLAVGTVAAKPVVVDDQVVIRRRVRVTMSCDHRVIDGATGAAFLKTLKQMLENPLAMLL